MNPAFFATIIVAAIVLAAVTLALLGLLASRTRQERQLERRVVGAQVIQDDFDTGARRPAARKARG